MKIGQPEIGELAADRMTESYHDARTDNNGR